MSNKPLANDNKKKTRNIGKSSSFRLRGREIASNGDCDGVCNEITDGCDICVARVRYDAVISMGNTIANVIIVAEYLSECLFVFHLQILFER